MDQIDAQHAAAYEVPGRTSGQSHPHDTVAGDVPSHQENKTYGEMDMDRDVLNTNAHVTGTESLLLKCRVPVWPDGG
jgi:hypothetical protein